MWFASQCPEDVVPAAAGRSKQTAKSGQHTVVDGRREQTRGAAMASSWEGTGPNTSRSGMYQSSKVVAVETGRVSAAAAEEELIAASTVWFGTAAARRRRSKKERKEVGRMGARASPPPSPRLLVGSWAEKPRGRSWD